MPLRLTPWRECNRSMRVLTVIAHLAWAGGMTSLFTLGGIETSALWQPKRAMGVYSRPLEVKGTIRFVTDFQQIAHAIAMPAMFGSMLVFLIAGVTYERIQKQRETDRGIAPWTTSFESEDGDGGYAA